MSEEVQNNTPQGDDTSVHPTRIGVRVVDVHAALQGAFDEFMLSGENQLEDLAKRIHGKLQEMPAFIIGEEHKL